MDVLKLIMLHSYENVVKKFQSSICHKSRENQVSPSLCLIDGRTDGRTNRQTEISNYRVATIILLTKCGKKIGIFLKKEQKTKNK